MSEYNKFGFNSEGQLDPLRRIVHDIVGLFPSTGESRPMADDLYAWIRNQKPSTGGQDDNTDTDTDTDPDKQKYKLVYNPRTGAFERRPVGGETTQEDKGVLSVNKTAATPTASSMNMYNPIQAQQYQGMRPLMTMPPQQNAGLFYLQRYLDPRYRGGM